MSGFVKEGREVVDKISKKRKENVQKIRKKWGGGANDEKEKEKISTGKAILSVSSCLKGESSP